LVFLSTKITVVSLVAGGVADEVSGVPEVPEVVDEEAEGADAAAARHPELLMIADIAKLNSTTRLARTTC